MGGTPTTIVEWEPCNVATILAKQTWLIQGFIMLRIILSIAMGNDAFVCKELCVWRRCSAGVCGGIDDKFHDRLVVNVSCGLPFRL